MDDMPENHELRLPVPGEGVAAFGVSVVTESLSEEPPVLVKPGRCAICFGGVMIASFEACTSPF